LNKGRQTDWDSLFRSYDIRGVYGEQLTPEDAKVLGIAISRYQGRGAEIVVGRDVRLSGEALCNGLESGLLTESDVFDVGVVSTPMVYFATNYLKAKAGVMITASHNPPEWNGFKLFKQNGCVHGEEMAQIKQIAKITPSEKPIGLNGKLRRVDNIFNEYNRFVSEKIKIHRKLSVVADTTNGVCGLFVPPLFKQHGCKILTLNENPDGRFPAHKPEPKEETLGELRQRVVSSAADFGVGFDGDGDRAVFVDGKGRVIPSDLALMVFAEEVLAENSGAPVVYELSCSMAVEEFVKKHGGIPIVERVGHTFIMDRMLSENAPLGGEKSGHFYFSETKGGDDAIFASLKMASILSRTTRSLADIYDSLPKYPSIFEESFRCSDKEKFLVIERLKIAFAEKGLKFVDVDGVKLINEDGWVLLRASNTEPIIRVSAEARTRAKLDEVYEFAKKELNRAMEGC
jgi:phosphomannomutase/phosphoglucomutase